MTVLVFLDPACPDGRLADAGTPTILATDQGLTRGDGIFESLLVTGGRPRKLQAHLDRLASSARIMDLPLPAQDAWERAITTAIAAFAAQVAAGAGTVDATGPGPAGSTGETGASAESAGEGGRYAPSTDLVVKLLVTRGPEGASTPTAWVQATARPAGAGREGRDLDVLLLERGYESTLAERAPWLLLGAKTLSYAVNMAALRHAKAQGADDVIFTSGDGLVLEGPTSSVLLARVGSDGTRRLITPQLDSGILPGTTQGALFAAARDAGWELGYGPVRPADLIAADALWLVSSIRLLAPVARIDGREVGTAEVRSRLTRELDALLELTA